MAHAQAYEDEGTPQEQSRRTFMVNAVIAMGGVIGLGIAIPALGSLVPTAEALQSNWSPLTPQELAALQKATDKPIKVTFTVKAKDAYLPEAQNEQFVWAIKTDDATLRAKRPDLFGNDKLPYPAVNLSFVLFSPICPHLGCKYSWSDQLNRFACPCHGSQFTNVGAHVAGPAQRGLDPLPFREQSGKAELTWIVYAPNTPHHIVLSYT
ncbi:MAG: ubiquinol-cytochrome c reductase iron-sulfur subunit [Candidatus Velthaea sp.]